MSTSLGQRIIVLEHDVESLLAAVEALHDVHNRIGDLGAEDSMLDDDNFALLREENEILERLFDEARRIRGSR